MRSTAFIVIPLQQLELFLNNVLPGKEHQEIYQALHHQFVASSLVTKVAHEKNPQNKNRLYDNKINDLSR